MTKKYLMTLTTVNACYVGSGNYMNILPAYMLSPNYDPNVNDAHNYANMMAWGHEIIHGFDTNGAKFNQVGNWGSLWANENDSQEFQKRAQQLIDYYSSLDIMRYGRYGEKKSVITITKFLYDEDQQTKLVVPMSWRNTILFPSVDGGSLCTGKSLAAGDRQP